MGHAYTYTYGDLTEEIRTGVEESRKAAEDIEDAIRRLRRLKSGCTDEELQAMLEGAEAAQHVANRMAAFALTALQTKTGPR